MNIHTIKEGFIKRAQDFNILIPQANWLFKQAFHGDAITAGLLAGNAAGSALALPGLYLGGGIGAASGLLDGTKDEKGETHRFKNMIYGLGKGGLTGGLAGYGLGAVGAGVPSALLADKVLSLKDSVTQ